MSIFYLNACSLASTLAALEEILQHIGNRIAHYRKLKGLNQSELARALDKDRQVIQKLETGLVNPTIKTLYDISIALDIDITDLLNPDPLKGK